MVNVSEITITNLLMIAVMRKLIITIIMNENKPVNNNIVNSECW